MCSRRDPAQLLAPLGRDGDWLAAPVVVRDLNALGVGDDLAVDGQLVLEVEALGAEPAGADGDLDLPPEAHRGPEVDLDPRDDQVHVLEPDREPLLLEERDPRLLEVGQEDCVVDVTHRVEIAEAHLLDVDHDALGHARDASEEAADEWPADAPGSPSPP